MCKMDIFGEEVKLDGHFGMYRACNIGFIYGLLH